MFSKSFPEMTDAELQAAHLQMVALAEQARASSSVYEYAELHKQMNEELLARHLTYARAEAITGMPTYPGQLSEAEANMIRLFRAGKHAQAEAAMLRIAADNIEATIPQPEPESESEEPVPSVDEVNRYVSKYDRLTNAEQIALVVMGELALKGWINRSMLTDECGGGLNWIFSDITKAINAAGEYLSVRDL